MQSPITVIIPTHNRPNYLRRTIQYYTNCKYPVLILDSSPTALELDSAPSISYIHLPDMSFPDKLYFGLTNITTTFVVMCADDDFLIPDGIDECVRFLQKNRKYSVADGSVLFYKKDDIIKSRINFNLIYKTDLDSSFNAENPFDRLSDFFRNYRTVFYGVHYTKNLLDAYGMCRHSFNNLFLSEYLSAFIPIAAGYCKIIPRLLMVREFTNESGDKTTPTLERMLSDKNGIEELNQYSFCVAKAIHPHTNATLRECVITIQKILQDYALKIKMDKRTEHTKSQSITKRIGKIILKVPFIGLAIIQQRRIQESKKEMAEVIKTNADTDNLKLIKKLIHDFRLIC